MKVVRNFLILLLSALMLTAFVACDPTPEAEVQPQPEPQPEPTPEALGDLIITKAYFDSAEKDEPNEDGLMPVDIKFVAIKNIGSEPIVLKDYFFGLKYSETDTRTITFGDGKLMPGVTLYILNNYDKGAAVMKTFENISLLPRVYFDTAEITQDSRVNAKNYFKGESTFEIGTEKKVVGQGAPILDDDGNQKTDKDGNPLFYNVYGWTTVDQILVDGENPTLETALIRNYDEEAKTSTGWTVVDWAAEDKIAKMDCERPDYTFETFKPNFEKEKDALSKYPVYAKMNAAELEAFQAAAGENHPAEIAENGNFYVQKAPGLIMGQFPSGSWFINDYTFDTFKTNYAKEQLEKYPQYAEMPETYKATFTQDASNAGMTPDFSVADEFSIKINDKASSKQTKDGWTHVDTTYVDVFDYNFETPETVPTTELCFADMNGYQAGSFKAAVNKSYTIDAETKTFVLEVSKTETETEVTVETLTQTGTAWKYDKVVTPKGEGPVVPKADRRFDQEYVLEQNVPVISFIYVKNADQEDRVSIVGFSNLTETAMDIKTTEISATVTKNDFTGTVENLSAKNDFTNAWMPKIQLKPGMSVFIGNLTDAELEKEGLGNFKNAVYWATKGDAADPVDYDAYYHNGYFKLTGKNALRYNSKKSSKFTVFEDVVCDNTGKIGDTENVLSCPHNNTLYVRTYNADKTKATGWDIYEANIPEMLKYLNGQIHTKPTV